MATAAAALQALLPNLAGTGWGCGHRSQAGAGSELARKAPSTSGTLAATALLRAGGLSPARKGCPLPSAWRTWSWRVGSAFR